MGAEEQSGRTWSSLYLNSRDNKRPHIIGWIGRKALERPGSSASQLHLWAHSHDTQSARPSQYSTSSQSDSVCVWQAEAINKTNKRKRKNVEDYGEKAQIYFTESACRVFFLASSFCKIDVKLNSSPSSCVLLLYNLHFFHFYIYFLLLFSTHTWTLTTSINYSCSLDNSIL